MVVLVQIIITIVELLVRYSYSYVETPTYYTPRHAQKSHFLRCSISTSPLSQLKLQQTIVGSLSTFFPRDHSTVRYKHQTRSQYYTRLQSIVYYIYWYHNRPVDQSIINHQSSLQLHETNSDNPTNQPTNQPTNERTTNQPTNQRKDRHQSQEETPHHTRFYITSQHHSITACIPPPLTAPKEDRRDFESRKPNSMRATTEAIAAVAVATVAPSNR